jgi:TonB-dependent starch-binding outer membrane protein SusC
MRECQTIKAFKKKKSLTIRPVLFQILAVVILQIGLFAGSGKLLAQEGGKTVTGIITFSGTGEPVPGANIVIKGTETGTISGIDGEYSIRVNEGDILIFSFIGYLKDEISVGKESIYNVSLSEDITQLDAVVKVGYGTMKRSDLTGAVVSVSSEDIKASSATSLDQALQGRAAGVLVTQNSGQPGGGVSVQIRGVNTLNSDSEPLYVVDGIPISGYTGGNTNALATINPGDIESMEVLKDASATAIYGSRAANGVVLITTNRGKKGNTQIRYEGQFGLQQLPVYVDVLNLQEYASFLNERQQIIGFGSKPEFADPSVLGEGTNWQKEMFRVAPMHNHNITLSGGDEKTNFALTGGYLNQEGIAIGSYFKRYSFGLNIDNKTRDWLTLGASIRGGRTDERVTITENNLLSVAIEQAPDIPAKNPDGSWGGPSEAFGITNPVAEALDHDNYVKRTQFIINLNADIKFFKWFTYRTELGGDISYTNNYRFDPTYNYGTVFSDVNSSRRTASNNFFWIFKNYLTFNHTIKKHFITAMIGMEAQASTYEYVEGYRENFLTNNIREINAGDIETSQASGGKSQWAMASYFGRLNYSFDDRYLLTATLRADGSSRFGPDKKWGFFPSYALAWKISNEAFMQDISSISNLKLRLGYGEVGGQNIGNYKYGSTLTNWPTYFGPGFLLTNLPNPDVQWESQNSYNIGIDLNMFQNRIEFITDAYLKNTDNLLLDLPMPLYTATDLDWTVAYIQPPSKNIGSMQNKGLEFTLNTVNIDRGLYWRSGLTLSINRNKITKLVNEGSFIDETIGVETISRTMVGEPVGQFIGYVTDGVFEDGDAVRNGAHTDGADVGTDPATSVWVGDIRFKDINGDGVITEADRALIGDPSPKFSFGFNNTFTYKNFELTIYLNGSYGNKIFNQLKRTNENTMSRRGMLSSVRDYARIEMIDPNGSLNDLDNVFVSNPGTSVPRIVSSDNNSNARISDRYIEDGSYLRIRNFNFGYNLPNSVINKIGLEKIRVYLNIQNLYTFTRYSGFDPEIGAQRQNVLKSGVDEGRYPSPRIYQFGLSIDF